MFSPELREGVEQEVPPQTEQSGAGQIQHDTTGDAEQVVSHEAAHGGREHVPADVGS